MQSRERPHLTMALLRCWMPSVTAWALTIAVAYDGQRPWPGRGALCAAAGSLAIYSADRIDDPKIPSATRVPLISATCFGVILVIGLLAGSSGWTWLIISGVGMVGLLHRWTRRWVPKNVVVGITWTIALMELAGIRHPTVLFLAALSLIIWSACLLCDLKDDASDAQDGTITVVHLVGRHGRRWAALAGLLLAAVIAQWGRLGVLEMTALGLLPLIFLPNALSRPLAGSILVDGTLALPGLVTALWRPPWSG